MTTVPELPRLPHVSHASGYLITTIDEAQQRFEAMYAAVKTDGACELPSFDPQEALPAEPPSSIGDTARGLVTRHAELAEATAGFAQSDDSVGTAVAASVDDSFQAKSEIFAIWRALSRWLDRQVVPLDSSSSQYEFSIMNRIHSDLSDAWQRLQVACDSQGVAVERIDAQTRNKARADQIGPWDPIAPAVPSAPAVSTADGYSIDNSPVTTGLGKPVDDIVDESSSLKSALRALQRQGYSIRYAPEDFRGSAVDPAAMTISVPAAVPGQEEDVVGALTQAAGLAHQPRGTPPPINGDKQQFENAYADWALRHDSAAMLFTAGVRQEILTGGGPDIGLPGASAETYDRIARMKADTQVTEEQALKRVSSALGAETRSDGRTLRQYYVDLYGERWDRNLGGILTPDGRPRSALWSQH